MRYGLAFGVILALAGGMAQGQATTRPVTLHDLLFTVPAKIEKLDNAATVSWAEGPTWIGGDDGFLVFSDAHADTLYKWTQAGGIVPWRTPSNASNGNTRDMEGRLVTCEQKSRRITRTEKDGTITVLADSYMGKHFTSPNDIVVKSDDSVWFTDPPLYDPNRAEKVLAGNNVFRIDGKTHAVTIVISDMTTPNGLCFSPDEKKLYVNNTGPIYVCEVHDDGTLGPRKLFVNPRVGISDGLRVDSMGCIWTSAGDGIEIFTPEAKWVGTIDMIDTLGVGTTNLCFGGVDNKTLFIASNSNNVGDIYRVDTKVAGASIPAGSKR